jgi:hypothetical protein
MPTVPTASTHPADPVAGLLAALTVSQGLHRATPRRGNTSPRPPAASGATPKTSPVQCPFAGGRALETPFGTFFGPNITPDKQTGIGNWSDADFKRAIRQGERPDGSHYFPAFPYPSFTGMSDQDIQDLWAYLKTIAADQPRQPRTRAAASRTACVFWWAAGRCCSSSPARNRSPLLRPIRCPGAPTW